MRTPENDFNAGVMRHRRSRDGLGQGRRTTSKICCMSAQDQSDKADLAAVEADLKRLRTQFEGALANMKKMAEG